MLRILSTACFISLFVGTLAWAQAEPAPESAETDTPTESTEQSKSAEEPATSDVPAEAASKDSEEAAGGEASKEAQTSETTDEPTQSTDVAPAQESPVNSEASSAEVSAADEQDGKVEEPNFIKGHLAHFGTTELLSRFSHIGIAAGPDFIGDQIFMRIDPGFAYYEWPVKFALHLPLRFEVATMDQNDEIRFESFGFRKQDYDEPADFAKFIRFITYGRKEERLFFSINSLRPATIGHGMVVNAYQPNIGINQSMTGLLFDAYNDYAGFQFQANDITFSNQVLGGLAFIKPASLFSEHWFAKGFSIGVEWLADLKAPRCIKSREFGNCLRPASLDVEATALDPDTFFNEQGLPYVETTPVQALGLSIESKIAKMSRTVDLKLYGTHHTFTNDGGGSGSSLGALARLNFGQSWITALRVRGELLMFDDGFIPGYFNSTYEADKYSFRTTEADQSLYLTKYQAIFGDPDNGLQRPLEGTRYGIRAEASFGLFKEDRSNKKLAGLISFQDATGQNDTEISLHVEAPFLEIVQVFGTYTRTHMKDMMELFKSDFMSAPNAMFLAGARVQVLPIFFINASYARRFQPTSASDDNVLNQLVDVESEDGSGGFRAFDNVQTIFIDFEVGYEL